MRKKFLKSAAAFSIAAACIMGGLAPATVGLPVEVAAATVVDPSTASEDAVKALLDSIVKDVIKQEGQVSKDGTAINLKVNESLKLGEPDAYTHGEEELANVTITIENTDCAKLEVAADKKSISIKSGETLTTDDVAGKTVTIKASVPKGMGSVTKDVTINLSFEEDVTPPAADTALAKSGISSVYVNGDYAEMYIEGVAGTQEILVGTGKVNKNKKTVSVASWATYEGSEADVDLSKLSNVKDNYLVISTPGNDVSIVKIPASAKSIKAQFDASEGLKVGTAATGKASASKLSDADAAKYEYRTAYSSWVNLQDDNGKLVDLGLYQEEGAKLFVRLCASGDSNITESSIDTSETWTYGSQKDIAVYKASTLPGREAKVAIKAKAKGPKVVADYAKGTVKFPRNSEFRLAAATNIYMKDGKAVDSPTDKVSVEKVYETIGLTATDRPTKVDVEVRTKATGTKAASKWGRLTIELPAAFAQGAITEGEADIAPDANQIEKDKEQEYGGKGVALSILKEAGSESNALKFEYSGTAKKPTLKITNNTGKDIAYEFVKESEGATKPGDSAKPVKAAKGKTITIKGIKDKEVIFVRAAGDKASQKWVGAYEKLGSIDVPKTITGTKDGGSGNVQTFTTKQLLGKIKDQYFMHEGVKADATKTSGQPLVFTKKDLPADGKFTVDVDDTEKTDNRDVEDVTVDITLTGNTYTSGMSTQNAFALSGQTVSYGTNGSDLTTANYSTFSLNPEINVVLKKTDDKGVEQKEEFSIQIKANDATD